MALIINMLIILLVINIIKCSSLFLGSQPIYSAINNKGELQIEEVFVIPYTWMDYVYFVTGPIGNSIYWSLITDKLSKNGKNNTKLKLNLGLLLVWSLINWFQLLHNILNMEIKMTNAIFLINIFNNSINKSNYSISIILVSRIICMYRYDKKWNEIDRHV